MTANQPHSAQQQLFFQPIVDSYLQNPRFIRRDWLAERAQQAMDQENCRFVLLTAEPGAGKSTFMAQLAYDHPDDWLVYFIRRDQRELLGDVGAKSFLLRIGYQLVSLHPHLFSKEQLKLSVSQRVGTTSKSGEIIGAEVETLLASPFYQKVIQIKQDVKNHAGRLVGLQVKELIVEERLLALEDLQYLALIDPAREALRQHPKLRIVVLVDALDEVRFHTTEQHLLSWLIACPELPQNVRIVLTSRAPDQALNLFCEEKKRFLQLLTIRADEGHVRSDLSQYMAKLVSNPRVSEELAKTDHGVTGFVTQAVEKADGNLGYLDVLGRAIDQALTRRDDLALEVLRDLLFLSDLPGEIEELYAFFLHKIKTRVSSARIDVEDDETGTKSREQAWSAVYRRILGVLSIALEPLTLSQIRGLGFIHTDLQDVVDAVDNLRQFLDVTNNKVRLYHATLAEFLTDPNIAENLDTADLHIEPKRWHRQIGDYYLKYYQTDWSRCDDYGLNNLSTHFYLAGDSNRLYSLINKGWMDAQIQRTYTVNSFAADVKLAIAAAERDSPQNLSQLIRSCLVYANLASFVIQLPRAFLGLLAQIGHVDRAISVVELIQDPIDRYNTHKMIADAFVRMQSKDKAARFLNEALRAARAFESEAAKGRALVAVVQAMAQLGDGESALGAAETIDSDEYKAQALGAAARALAQSGERTVLDRVLGAVEGIKPEWFRATALGEVAQALAQIGDLEAAVRIYEAIKYHGEVRATVFGAIIGSMARCADAKVLLETAERVIAAGDFGDEANVALAYESLAQGLARIEDGTELSQALATVKSIENDRIKAISIGAIIKALGQVGDKAGLNQALAVVETIKNDKYSIQLDRADALGKIAQTLLQIGDTAELDHVLIAIESIKSDECKARALAAVVAALAQAGDVTRARIVAQKVLIEIDGITYERAKADALEAIAEPLAMAGDKAALDRALAAAESMKDDEFRCQALEATIRMLALGGDADAALAAAKRAIAPRATTGEMGRIRQDRLKAAGYEAIAHVLAHMENEAELQRALAELEITADYQLIEAVFKGVAEKMGQTGNKTALTHVLAAAQMLKPGWIKDSALRAIAQALAQLGDGEFALAVAETIENRQDETEALKVVVAALAQAGDGAGLIRALAAAETMKEYKAQAVGEVVQALARVGDKAQLDRALAAVETISLDWIKVTALGAVAQRLAEMCDRAGLDRALTAAETIKGDEYSAKGNIWILGAKYKASVLAAVAQALAQVGDRAGLVRTLAAVETIQCRSQRDKAPALVAVAQALAQLGDRESALAAAEKIENDEDKALALKAVMQALIQTGDAEALLAAVQRSVEIVESINEPVYKAQALAAVMNALAHVENDDAILAMVQKAPLTVETTAAEQAKAHALSAVAQALATAGDAKAALIAAHAINDDNHKDEALGAVIRALTQTRDLQTGLSVLEEMKDKGLKARALGAMSQALARMGDKSGLDRLREKVETTLIDLIKNDEQKANEGKAEAYARLQAQGIRGVLASRMVAEELSSAAETTVDEQELVSSLVSWAKVAAEVGDRAGLDRGVAVKALAKLKSIKDDKRKAEALGTAAPALAQVCDKRLLREFLAVAETIQTDWIKASALGTMAQSMVQGGNGAAAREAAQKALAAARATSDERAKAWVLGIAAQALAQVGNIAGLSQAVKVAEAILYEPAKAHALGMVAQALAHVGQVEAARKAIQGALITTELITDPEKRVQSLVTLAQALAYLDDLPSAQMLTQRALATFEEMIRPIEVDHFTPGAISFPSFSNQQVVQALQVVILTMAQVGDRSGLVQAFQMHHQRASVAITTALAKVGDMDTALAAANAIADDQERAQALEAVSQAVAQEGNRASSFRALSIIDSIPFKHKARSLSKMSLTFERLGESDLAIWTWLSALKAAYVRGEISYYEILSDGISGLPALRQVDILVNIDKSIKEVSGWLVLA